MAKRKHSPEWMLARVQEYLDGTVSYESIAIANRIGADSTFEIIMGLFNKFLSENNGILAGQQL